MREAPRLQAPGPIERSVPCPRCHVLVEVRLDPDASFPEPPACRGCGAGLVRAGDRLLAVLAATQSVEAPEVPRRLAAALRAQVSPRHRLLEVHRLELPYWRLPSGAMQAAFSTPIDAALRLESPLGDLVPAALVIPPLAPAASGDAPPVALVLVPAFDVRYEVRGRAFHALLDANRARLLADLLPSPFTVRLHLAMAAVLALDVAAFTAAAYLAPDNLVRSIAVAALSVPVYGLTAAAFRLREK